MSIRKALIPMIFILSGLCITPTVLANGGTWGDDQASAPSFHSPISLKQAERLLGQKDVYFFDVNPEDIWQQGHIPGAVNINKPDWQSLLPTNKTATLIFYCMNKLCVASDEAAKATEAMGYTHVFTMPEGIFGWMSSGRNLEKEPVADFNFNPS